MQADKSGRLAPRVIVPDEFDDDTHDPLFRHKLGDPWRVEAANPITEALSATRELFRRKRQLIELGGMRRGCPEHLSASDPVLRESLRELLAMSLRFVGGRVPPHMWAVADEELRRFAAAVESLIAFDPIRKRRSQWPDDLPAAFALAERWEHHLNAAAGADYRVEVPEVWDPKRKCVIVDGGRKGSHVH